MIQFVSPGRVLVAVLAFGLAACGDNPEMPDARIQDAPFPVDGPPDGPCGAGRLVTGELVDLDSSATAFMGVNNATFTQRGGTATDTTAPNGRFEMCVPSTTSYVFDVDMPSDRLDAIAYLEVEALGGLHPISFRSLSTVRATSFYIERGLVFDAAKAHVLVFLAGDRSNLTFDRAHGTVQAGNDDGTPGTFTWSASQAGRHLLFPNVDASNATGTLAGDFSGAHTIPLEAGKLTFVAIAWVSV